MQVRNIFGFTIGLSLLLSTVALAQSTTIKAINSRALFDVDKISGLGTRITSEGLVGYSGINPIAYNGNSDTLYGLDFNNRTELVLINPDTGRGEPIGGTGFLDLNSITYDPNNNILYALSTPSSGNSKLVVLNQQTGLGSILRELDRGLLQALAFDAATSTLYAIDGLGLNDTLVSINPLSGVTSNILATGYRNTQSMTIDSATRTAYALDNNGGAVFRINLNTNVVSLVGSVGLYRAYGLAFRSNGARLYAMNTQPSNLMQLNSSNGTTVAQIALGFDRVKGLAYDPRSSTLFGMDTYGNDRLLSIDLYSGEGTILGAASGFSDFLAIAFDTDSQQLFGINDLDRTLYRLTWSGGVLTRTALGLPTLPPGTRSLVYEPTTRNLYAATQAGELLRINLLNRTVQTVSQLNYFPLRGLSYNPTDSAFYGTTESQQLIRITAQNLAGELLSTLSTGAVYGLAYVGSELLGVTGSKVLSINPFTAQASTIGELGFYQLQGLAYDASQNVYFAATETGTFTQLVRIDPLTNRATAVGPITGFNRISGLAHDNNSGTLYGIDPLQRKMLIINKNNGQPRVSWSINTSNAKGLAFIPNGASGFLITVDLSLKKLMLFSTSIPTGVTYGASFAGTQIEGLEYDLSSGQLYGTDTLNLQLVRINPANGSRTVIGSTGYQLRGL